jgi:hypothetical protein
MPTASWKARPPTNVRKAVAMPSNPVFTYRREVQDYLRSCEHLLAAASAPPPLTQEELAMVQYYVAEVQKILPVSVGK